MAMMQTPHGRVIGLILPVEDQPKPKAAVEDKPEAEAKPEAKTAPAKKAGRPARK